jgi:hypothetical protein
VHGHPGFRLAIGISARKNINGEGSGRPTSGRWQDMTPTTYQLPEASHEAERGLHVEIRARVTVAFDSSLKACPPKSLPHLGLPITLLMGPPSVSINTALLFTFSM